MPWPESHTLLHGRYRILQPLGAGAHGAVWLAEDTLRRAEVALKLLPPGAGLPWTRRRELAALQLLRLPGVVRLLDEGEVAAPDGTLHAALVMERVQGAPFPDRGAPVGWSALRPALHALLEVLERVHRAGVVHRDMKPSHIRLVTPDRPVLLDFGAACGVGVSARRDPQSWSVGSLRWAAPEQLIDAESADPRSDLYAVGVLAVEALCGAGPHPDGDPDTLRRARLSAAPVLPPPLVEPLPPEAARWLLALLARRRADRPPDARAARLGLGPPPERPAPGPWTLCGEDRLHRLRTDAHAALALRGAHKPEQAQAQLRAWVEQGLATHGPEGVHLDRPALDRLEQELVPLEPHPAPHTLPRGAPGRMRLLLHSGQIGEALDEGRAVAEGLWAQGRVLAALAVLEPLLPLARDTLPLLHLYTRAALAAQSAAEAGRALYEWMRAEVPEDHRQPMVALLRAHRAARERELARGLDTWRAVPPFADEALDRWRQAVRMDLSQLEAPAAQDAALAEAWRWAEARGTPSARADAESWEGLLCYHRLDFDRSAALLRRAAEGKPHPTGRLSALANLCAALLDGGDLAGAEEAAAELEPAARACGLVVHVALAEWVRRSAHYRSGRPCPPDPELAEGARALHSAARRGQLLFTEAAIAWRWAIDERWSDQNLSHTLAQEALAAWSAAPEAPTTRLAYALLLATAPTPDPEAQAALAGKLLASDRAPGLVLQALGVLCWSQPALRAAHRSELDDRIARLPPALARGRRELMTLEEVGSVAHTRRAGAT